MQLVIESFHFVCDYVSLCAIISQNVIFNLIGLTHQATIKQIPLNPSLTN